MTYFSIALFSTFQTKYIFLEYNPKFYKDILKIFPHNVVKDMFDINFNDTVATILIGFGRNKASPFLKKKNEVKIFLNLPSRKFAPLESSKSRKIFELENSRLTSSLTFSLMEE